MKIELIVTLMVAAAAAAPSKYSSFVRSSSTLGEDEVTKPSAEVSKRYDHYPVDKRATSISAETSYDIDSAADVEKRALLRIPDKYDYTRYGRDVEKRGLSQVSYYKYKFADDDDNKVEKRGLSTGGWRKYKIVEDEDEDELEKRAGSVYGKYDGTYTK